MAPIRLQTPWFRNIILTSGLLIFFGLCLAYALFQARFLIAGPQVSLTEEPATIHSERQIKISGVAKNITAIYLNGRPITTTEDGAFSEALILENGYTTMTVSAVDRFGRSTEITRDYVYTGPGSTFSNKQTTYGKKDSEENQT